MIPRKIFSEEHEIFRDSVRRFFDAEVAPHYETWEEEGKVPRALWGKLGEAGFLCPTVPEEYGGPGGDYLFNAIVDEEIMRYGAAGIAGISVHNDIIVPYLVDYGTEEQKTTWLPRMVSGEVVTAIGMTEPGGGSDLQAIRTKAVLDGNHYVINGQKTFISNGQSADMVLAAVKTDTDLGAKGTSLVMIEADREGYSRGRNLKKIGQRAGDTSELFFADVRVPTTNMVGEEGQGFRYMMEKLPQERLAIAVMAAAHAEAALEWTVAYVKERKAFGRSIAEFQNTRFKMAEMFADVTAGRTFVDRCLELHLDGGLDVPTAAMAKFWLTEVECRVMDECLQLHGGYGYMREFPIARAWADARVQRIYGGTTEIMKEIVARSIFPKE